MDSDRYEALTAVVEAIRDCPDEVFDGYYREVFHFVEQARRERGYVWKEGKVVKKTEAKVA